VLATWRAEGARGFYRGAVPGLLGSGASWGLYFFFYEACKRRMLLPADGGAAGGGAPAPSPAKLSTAQTLFAAWAAGSATCLFTNPLWLIKTRMALQTDSSVSWAAPAAAAATAATGAGAAQPAAAAAAAAAAPRAPAQAQAQAPYRGVRDAFASILREEGPRGLYRGLLPALLLTSHGMVQFAVYEELKARFPPPPAASAAGGAGASPFALSASAQIFVFGAASKAAAVCVTYPSQVVKARLQQRLVDGAPAFAGLADCVRRTAQLEGVRGFYRGFAANLMRVAPQSALTLVVYEEVKRALDRLDPARA
jgi:solute carrier family 25 folate transporter 32